VAKLRFERNNADQRSNKDISAFLKPELGVLAAIQRDFDGLLLGPSDAGSKIGVVLFYEELSVLGIGWVSVSDMAYLYIKLN
jgi:hypothetical protein